MTYLGDLNPSDVLDCKFTTTAAATGAPTALAGTPAISVYKDNSVTQSTAGVTLTADFDGVTGLNNVRVDTSADGTFYAAGSNFQVVITAGTVGGTSAVGYVVAQFSIQKRSPLRPTVAGRSLDVTATGAAGVDWSNVENPSTAVNLSATNIDPDQAVASVTGSVGSVTGNVGGSVLGSVASVTGNVGGNVTGSVGSVVGNVGGNVNGSTASVTGAVGSVTGSVGSVTGSVGSVVADVGITQAAADTIFDRAAGIETGWTLRQGLRIMLGVLGGKSSGFPSAPVFRNPGDTKNRLSATLDANGNRTAATTDPS